MNKDSKECDVRWYCY